MLRRIPTVLLATLLVCVGLAASPMASADVNDFTVNNMTADYTLGTADPQGILVVREQLTVQFSDYNHGILRALPKDYNGSSLHIHVSGISRDNHPEPYSTYTDNGNEVLKIGSATSTITGLHHYEISYDVHNVVRFVGDKPELDWNVNGTQWQQPFQAVQATLHVPASMVAAASKTSCFTGVFHSTATDCLVAHSGQLITISTDQVLASGETLTFNTPLPVGVFRQPTLRDTIGDHLIQLAELIGLPLVAFVAGYAIWSRRGRDVRGRGTIVPEYSPPADLKPAEIDVILHNKLGKNAISATIIDLAIRKYLRIQETQSNGLLGIGKHKTYSFVRLPAPTNSQLNYYEADVIAGLFASGDNVEISDLRKSFYKTAQAVQKAVPRQLATLGYFSSNPSRAGNTGHVFGIAMIFVAFYLIGVSLALALGFIASGLIIIVFASLMPRRTEKGAAAKDASEGLKLYLNTAEKDRIAMLQSPNAPYAQQSAEPTKTVELFEKLLPYAMVLGVEKQWAQQFVDIYKTPPDWYGGNWSTFNAVYLADSLSSSMAVMNTSFAAPNTSGSGSGFSGGAGGGGGGGGGGGW